ncbi:uncharacterized protein LOC121439566 isoform X2 [Microtus oregoni]|nr:uncharacterized protein LOC121439566 isoform X2 [Microtus oregoni]XP_041496015.1 uncharacterized protein LOC121439566 isoform X2 [Microtus oregoni]
MMNIIEADLTCISGDSTGWSQEYISRSIDRSFQKIFHHLENARSTLMKTLKEPQDWSSSGSDIVGTTGNRSSDSSMSSVSYSDSSNPSLPVFPGRATRQFRSHSFPALSRKEPPAPRSRGSSLPTLQKTDLKKSLLNESLDPLVWAPLQLSPIVRGELERHISHKVSTLRAQVVHLPVKKSWEIRNELMNVQGVPEQGLPKTQLPTLLPQRAEQNTNSSPDAPSFHVHVNIGVNSELSRTEVSQTLTSNKQLQSANDHQVLSYNPVVISMGTPAPINIVREENALIKKDPRHVLELNRDQRVLGLPEQRIQPQRAQVTDVELTAQVPRSATDSVKVTPVALLQVMGLMGMIPESHAQVIDCVGFPPQPPNQAETVNLTPQSSDQVIKPKTVKIQQYSATESKSMASRQSPVTDNMKVTPAELLRIMDSMGMINELYPHVIKPAEIAPKPQYQVMESAKVDILHGHQEIPPEDKSLGLQQSVLGTVEVIPQPQHKVMGTPNMTLGPQNQATEHIGIAPGPIHENILEISSSALPKAIDYTKATPVAQQTMDFMQKIPPGEPHITEPRALIQTENLTTLPAQPDVLTSTVPRGAAESRGIPPQLPSTVLASSGVILLPSGQSLHALKVTPIVQAPPGVGMIPPLQVVEPPGLIPQPVAQVKEPLDLPSGFQVQAGDSVGMTPQHQGAEGVSSTPGLSQQVMDPSKFTPRHQDLDYSEVSPRQSHKIPERGGTSDTQPQMKNSVEMTEVHNQIVEPVRTITAPLDQGTIPIGRSQKHHVTEVVPVTPLLKEMKHLGENSIPQPKVMDSTNLSPELQNVKSEHLIPDPRLRNMKSVDIAMALVPEKVKYGPPTSRAVSTDLTLELHQLIMQFEKLTHRPQLQSEESVPSAPESQLQDVKSGQVIVEAQLQNIQSAGLAPGPQVQSDKSVHLTPGSQTQGMQRVVHSALSQELQGDTKMVELAPRPSLEDKKSVNLTRKPYSQSTSFEKTAHVPLLEDRKTLLVEGRSLIPEALVESVNLSELVPSTHLCAVKSLEVNPDPSYHFLEPAELALRHQAPEERVGSDICHQVEESVELTQSSLGMRLTPLRQTSDSMEMYSPPLQETLETRNQVVKEMEETPESQNAIKDALDLLPESEVQNMNSVVMAPEPHPYSDGKFLHGTLESCSEITLRPEYKDRETIRLTLPKVDDTQGAMIEPYSEMESLELGLEPGVQGEKSESLAQHLQSGEVIGKPPVLAVETITLTTGPKPHIKHVIPGPQLKVKLRQMDTESQLQNEDSINVTRQSSLGEVGPEKTKPESGPQSPSPKELIEETQPPKVKSVHFNLGPQQLSIKSGLIPGPQLQSVRFPKFYQGGKRGNVISGPPRYGVKSDEAPSRSPVPEIRSSDCIPGPNLPEAKLQHVKPVEVNVGPCSQAVKFSDLTPEPKHQGFRCTQVIPGIHFQDRKSQGLLPEPFLPLSQEPQVEDRKLVLPMEVSEFHSRKHTIPASELQYPSMISEEVNPELRQQDTKVSEFASRLRPQGVKFGEQTAGPLFHGMHFMTPELGIHNPKLAKMTPELNDTKQVSFNSWPCLQNVNFFDGTSGTQSQGVTTSELHSGPQLECVKMFEFTTQPKRQGMKPELIIQETLFEDRAYVTRNQAPSFEDEMSYKLPSGPQIPMAESVRLTPGIQLASVDHSELVGRPEAQGIESSESIPGQHLGHIKCVEKVTASKQEELTPGPHLGDVKSMELRSKSERENVKAILLTPGKQAGDKEPEELPLGPNLKGLKSELLPSRPQLEDRRSAVLTLGQCPERIKSTVVSPCSSQSDGTKTVKLIPGSTIQDLKTVGLARDTHVQDLNAMGLKLEPKQEESPVTFVPGKEFQDEFMEVLQVPQLQGLKPKELTAQSQMRGRKHVIISCLKPQSLKPVNIAKTQGIPGVKLVNLVSTQPCRGMAPTDLTLKPGQDDQITVRSPEWKGGVLDQLSKHFESENVLSMKSGQEAKPADKKRKEIKFKVQFKDTPSFESTPKPVVHSVKPEEAQDEPQVPSMKPCQVTPGPQEHQVKVSEPMLEPPFQDVKTMVLTEPHTGSTKSVRWIPISEFQSEKWVGSDLRLQSQSAKPTELKPSTEWRGVRPSELTVRSKIVQEEKSVGLHLEPQSQQVKTSPLALGLQKTKTLNLTSEPQPQGIKTVDQNKDPPVGRVRSIEWIPGPEFHSMKCLGLNYGSQSQGVKSTEQKMSIQLGGVKPSETTVRPKLQEEKSVGFNLESQVNYTKTPELSPEPEIQKGENVTSNSEPQPQGIKTVDQNQDPSVVSVRSVQWIPGPEFHSVKCLGLNRGSQSQGVKSTEQKPSIQLGGVKRPETTVRPKLQGNKSADFNLEPKVQHIKTPGASPKPELQEGENSEPQSECVKSVALHDGSEPQSDCVKSVALHHRSEPQAECVKSVAFHNGSEPQAECVKSVALHHGSEPQAECVKSVAFHDGSEPKVKCVKSVALHHRSEPQAESVKSVALHHRSEPQAERVKSVALHHRSEPKAKCVKSVALHHGLQLENTKSVQWIPASGYQAKKSMLNLRLQSEDVTAKELNPLAQLKNVKTSNELITGLKLQSKQLTGSTPEQQSRGFKTIDFKSERQFRSMKGCDPNVRSKINNIKFTFEPRFPLEVTGSPGLNPGMQPQEVTLGSPPGTQPQSVTSLVFKQESQASEANYGVLSQRAQPQSSMELKSAKSSELALQTKPWDIKSEINSGPQWQSAECSDLTPETESQNMKCVTSSQGKPFANQSVQLDCKHGSQWQGIKSNPGLRTKSQEMEIEDCESGPQLQDLKSSRTIMGIKVQDVISMGFTPGPQLQGMPSEVLTEKRVHGVKLVESKPSSKLQGKKPDFTPRKMFLGTKSVELDSVSPLQDLKYAEQILGMKLQDVNSMEHHVTSIKSPELVTQIKSQGIKAMDFNSGSQPQNKKPSELAHGKKLQSMESLIVESKSPNGESVELNLCVNSSVCTPGPSLPCVNSSVCTPGPSPPCVNSSVCTPGPSPPCVNSTECNSKAHFQNVNSSACIPSQNPQCEHSNRNNLGPLLQGMHSGTTFPAAQMMCVNSVWCSVQTHLQNVNSSACPRRQESQSANSMGYNPGPHLEAPKHQGMKFPELNPGTGIQREMPITVNPGQHLQDLRLELTPGSNIAGIAPAEYNPGPQEQCMNFSELNPGLELQRINLAKLGSGPQLQNIESFAWTPGSESQYTRPVLLSPGPPFQGVKPSNLSVGAKFQEIPFLKKQFGSRQQTAQPMLTPKPQSTGVDSVEVLPTPLPEDKMFPEMSKQPLLFLPRSGNSVGLSPSPFLQNVTFGNQIPQTNDQITEPSKVTGRPAHHLVDYAEMNTKIRYQAPKLVNYIPLPVYQEDAGSSEMMKGLGHKSTETTEKSMRLTSKPTDTVTESLGMPQQPELQVPGFADLTPTLSDQKGSDASELTPQKNYQSLETLELLSCSWPQVKDFVQSQTQPATGSKRMTLDLKNHATEMTGLTCKIRQGKEFLRVSSTPVNRENECVEKSPRPYPQDLEPVMGSSEKRSPREQSVASSPRPFYHVPDSAPGITPGPQIPESVGLISKPWLQREEFLELAAKPTNQVVGNTASVELPFEECQTEEVGSGLPTPQKTSIEKVNATPIESLDQIINFVTVSPKPLNQMTEPAKTQLQVPQVSKSLTVIPGPPLQVIESVMIPEPTSQGSKYVDLTPKLHDMIVSEFAPRLWLQNVQTKKLIAEPTHQILEMIELPGFQVIKTILHPKPLLLIARSEELAPGPSPQAVEPIGVATRSRTQVKDPLNLLPRPHLQDKIKPIERTLRANIQENFPELILQQTSPLEEPPVLTHKQRLQAGKSVGLKRDSPKVLEMDLNQGRAFQNRDSEMITSEKLQAENYFSRFLSSPPIPFISSSVKTSELGPLQGSGMPEVSRARTMKNFNVGILQSPESYTDTIRIRSPALPLVLPSDKTGNSVGSLYPEIWDMDFITKESTEKKQMEEFGNTLQSYSPYPLRLLPSEFQAGLGARRNSIRSFLGRQLNIWESHVCRQRLPRKYLSNMLMLGNVLGTTMERKLCSQPFLTEGATMGICQSIQNLFGVPAELMEFSQSLLERGPRTISQTSVVKNYIQRHILGHGHEKRIPLKMWTRGSTSSIIQQYSGTRLGLKKTNSKLSDIFQEATQHVPVSCTGAQFFALGKPESPFGILYSREDPVSREPSNISQSDSQTGTSETHHSFEASYFSQTNTELSEELKDLKLEIAAKLLRSQIPYNVRPPSESGLVLKYPICLQCGLFSECGCGHKSQSAYILVYPQTHLIKTPEGRGEIQTHLGFRLHIRKRPQVSKDCGRNRADTSKNPSSSSHRKAKIYTPVSKSPTSTRDFQSGSSQSPASVPVHRRQKQWGSHGVARKTKAKDSGHYEFCEVLSASESDSESNQHEKWAKSRLSKTSDLKYPMKKITKELKKQNIKLYKNSRPTEECPSGTLTDPSRSKSIKTTQTSTVSSKRQPKKSSQPRFIQRLSQGLKQAFQRAHRAMAITRQKPEDRASPDNLWSSKNLYPEEKDEDDCLTDGRGASTPVIKQKFMGSTPKKEDRSQETCDQAQQSKQVSSLQPRPLELAKNIVSERNVIILATPILQPLSRVLNVNSRTKKNYEFFSPESKNCSKVGAKFQVQETLVPDSLLKRTMQSHFKHEQEQHRTYHSLSERSLRTHHSPQRKPRSPSDRTLSSLSVRGCRSPSQRKDGSPSRRTPQSISDRSPPRLSKGRGRSPSGRSQPSPSGRRPRSSSGRSPRSSTPSSPRERRGRNPSPKGWLGLYGRNQHSPPYQRCCSPSKRSHLSPIQRTWASPSEWSHSTLSERPPSRRSGRTRQSSSERGYRSPSRSRLHRPSSGLHRSHSQRTHYSPSDSRSSHSERSRHLERNQQGHHARPHHSPKGRLRHSSPKERPRHSWSKEFLQIFT